MRWPATGWGWRRSWPPSGSAPTRSEASRGTSGSGRGTGGRHQAPGTRPPDPASRVWRLVSGIRHPASDLFLYGRYRRLPYHDSAISSRRLIVSTSGREAIENLSREDRTFPPSPAFVAAAAAGPGIYTEAEADWVGFWAKQARERLTCFTQPKQALDDSQAPFYKWFADGVLNLSYNCLDRHLAAGGGDKVAYHLEGEPGDTRTITFAELHAEVCRFANALSDLGVVKGDRVAIYMGMIPELPVAMLACARIGAVHTVVFGGFSAAALADRIHHSSAKVLVTQDGAWRRGSIVPLKGAGDAAADRCPSIEHVVVVKRCSNEVTMKPGRDHWYHDLVAKASAERAPEPLNAEDPLYILYTSGTTAKPKGIVHTQGGYLTQIVSTHALVFDIKPNDGYWCAPDPRRGTRGP